MQHAERVLRILELRDQIEGVVFCDYKERDEDFSCKPEPAFYYKVCLLFLHTLYTNLMTPPGQAMNQAGVQDPTKCLFVDDSLGNVEGAKRVGWNRCVHFRECVPHTIEELRVNHTASDQEKFPTEDGMPIINDLQQLREVWPDIFVQAEQ